MEIIISTCHASAILTGKLDRLGNGADPDSHDESLMLKSKVYHNCDGYKIQFHIQLFFFSFFLVQSVVLLYII